MKIKLPSRIKHYLLRRKINKEHFNWFLQKYNCQANKLPLEFIELLSTNPNFLVDLKNKNLSIELLRKIVWNEYKLNDITYENSWLLAYLNFPNDDIQAVITLKTAIAKEVNFQSGNYCFFKYEETEKDEKANEDEHQDNSIESYIDSVNIPVNNGLYEVIAPHLIKRLGKALSCPVAPNSLIQLNSNIGTYFHKGTPVFDQNTILYIRFNEYKRIIMTNKEFAEQLAQYQIIFFEDDDKGSKLLERLTKASEQSLYDNEYEKIKINHLLYLIEQSDSIPEDLKLLYSYKIKKYNSRIATENIGERYEIYSQLMQIVERLEQILGIEKIQELTNNFGEESWELKTKPIEPPVYSLELFMLENNISELETISDNQLLQWFTKLSKKELTTLLADVRVVNRLPNLLKENMSLDKRLIAIERELFIINSQPNDDIIKFIRRLKIDVEKLLTQDGSIIKSPQHINELTDKYGIGASETETSFSLKNIFGYNTWMFGGKKQNLLLSLSYFFDSKGSDYKVRSIGLLEYDNEELIPKLQRSFRMHPICIKEADDGKYYVTDGLHRFSILKTHYLLEKLAGKKSDEELEQKYTIPVKLTNLDYFKTYCNYLLSILMKEGTAHVSAELDDRHKYTGFSKIKMNGAPIRILDDNGLKDLVASALQTADELAIEEIAHNYVKYQSFRNFVDENFEDLKMRINNRRGAKHGKN